MKNIRNMLKFLYYWMYDRKLYSSYNRYKSADEDNKFIHILEAINYLRVAGDNGKELPQTYFEFGCHSARTFTAAINAARFLKMSNTEFFAFDSFQGLPVTTDEDGYFQQGTFHTSKETFTKIVARKTGVRLTNDQVISGFYSESLTPDLASRLPKIGVLHIDVDLYSSTITVLNFLKPLLSIGTLIVFDDWYCYPPGDEKGERLAFDEFRNSQVGFKFEEWKAYSTFGKSFFVTNIPDKK